MDLGWQPFNYTLFNQRILEELFIFACEASLQILRPGSSNHTYMGELSNIEQFFFSFFLMLAINSIVANALLFSSLLLVIGVPVFYMTQTNPEDNRNPNIKKIEILAGVWFHLVLLQALVGEYITHQMSV